MRLVRQRNDFDCGIATAAMVCGKTWREAAKQTPDPEKSQGLQTKEFMLLCLRLGQSVSMVCDPRPSLRGVEVSPRCVAILVLRPGEEEGHYVAFSDGKVYDPHCKAPVPWSVYRRRRWGLARWFLVR